MYISPLSGISFEYGIASFPSGSAVRNLPTMQEQQEARVWSLSWEDSLEEGMATHSSILAWKIPWTEEPGRLQSMGSQTVGHEWAIWLSLYFQGHFFFLNTAMPSATWPVLQGSKSAGGLVLCEPRPYRGPLPSHSSWSEAPASSPWQHHLSSLSSKHSSPHMVTKDIFVCDENDYF